MIVTNPLGPFDPNWDSLERYQVPEWYLDAKFGIFIHWGVYSVPAFANEWYPRNMYVQGTREFEYHQQTYGSHEQFGYKDFIPMFTAEKFNADDWIQLFADAGAKFVVPVAEHHDGFAMYPTKSNKWHAGEMGPKRDIVGELATATRKKGLIFGVSSHRAEHWWFMNGGKDFPSDVQNPEFADFYGPANPGSFDFGKNVPDEPYLEDWLSRCAELVDNYRPQLFWFDWWIEQPTFAPYLRRFASYYYNRAYAWGSGVAINYKNEAFPEKAAVFDVERGQLSDIRSKFWQTDTAVAKNSWCYIDGLEYKTAASIIHDLIDIVSKNGALLLNIGPRADGSIPEGDQKILRSIGKWLSVNGESIYGTRPWKVYGEGPTRVPTGSFTDTNRLEFTAEDIRFTQRDGALYAVVLSTESRSIRIRSLGTTLGLDSRTIARVSILGSGDVSFEATPGALIVELPNELPSSDAVAIKVEFA